MPPNQQVVDDLDWGMIGLSGILLGVAIGGALFTLWWGTGGIRRPSAAAFSMLQRARLLALLFAALVAGTETLRLQLLWGPGSDILPGGFHPITFCRLYIALMYGGFEPAFLLVVLFACHYANHGSRSSSAAGGSGGSSSDGTAAAAVAKLGTAGRPAGPGGSSPNLRILMLSAVWILPLAGVQIFAALFTRIFPMLHYSSSRLLRIFFAAYLNQSNPSMAQHCDGASSPGNCAFCTFPLLSTLASGVFGVAFLVAFLRATQQVVASTISRALVRRVRALQALTFILLVASTTVRGLTQLYFPWSWGFEMLRVAHVMATVALLLSVCYILVLLPAFDTAAADRKIEQHRRAVKKTARAAAAKAAAAAGEGVDDGGGGGGGAKGLACCFFLSSSKRRRATGGMAAGPGGTVPLAMQSSRGALGCVPMSNGGGSASSGGQIVGCQDGGGNRPSTQHALNDVEHGNGHGASPSPHKGLPGEAASRVLAHCREPAIRPSSGIALRPPGGLATNSLPVYLAGRRGDSLDEAMYSVNSELPSTAPSEDRV